MGCSVFSACESNNGQANVTSVISTTRWYDIRIDLGSRSIGGFREKASVALFISHQLQSPSKSERLISHLYAELLLPVKPRYILEPRLFWLSHKRADRGGKAGRCFVFVAQGFVHGTKGFEPSSTVSVRHVKGTNLISKHKTKTAAFSAVRGCRTLDFPRLSVSDSLYPPCSRANALRVGRALYLHIHLSSHAVPTVPEAKSPRTESRKQKSVSRTRSRIALLRGGDGVSMKSQSLRCQDVGLMAKSHDGCHQDLGCVTITCATGSC